MIYAGSFLVSAIAFALLARGETEPWAKNEIQKEQANGEHDTAEQLVKKNSNNTVA